jgi:hypothetical protein
MPLALGSTQVKTPKMRKSALLVVSREWMPVCQ